jgi:Na+/H+-dicarboxylate symporter
VTHFSWLDGSIVGLYLLATIFEKGFAGATPGILMALAMACLVWYSTITIYISVRGVLDIRDMLTRLKSTLEKAPPQTGSDPSDAK